MLSFFFPTSRSMKSSTGGVFLLIAVIFVLVGRSTQQDGIVTLGNSNFTEFVNKNPKMVILFYSTWCGHTEDIVRNMSDIYENVYKKRSAGNEVVFAKIDANYHRETAKKMNIRGYPSIRLKNNEEYIEYEYDPTKKDFKYFIDLLLFNKLPQFQSVSALDSNKRKFQIIFVGNVSIFPNLWEEYLKLAKENTLYSFMQIDPNANFYAKYFIPEKNLDSVGYILLLRRWDNFDKRIKLIDDNKEKFLERFAKFYKVNHKPYILYGFNHRIRKYLTDSKNTLVISYFNRKKVYADKFSLNSFENATRDFYQTDYYRRDTNFMQIISDYKIIWMIADLDDGTTKRLGFLLGVGENDLPVAVGFSFNKEKKNLFKYKFPPTRIFSFKELILSTLTNTHPNNYGTHSYRLTKNFPQLANSKVVQVGFGNFDLYLKMRHPDQKQVLFVVEYSANFCLHSKKLSIILDKLSSKLAELNGVKIQFLRMHLYGNDMDTYAVEKVPHIRFYRAEMNFRDYGVENYSEKDIIDEIEKETLGIKENVMKKTEL